MKKKGKRGAPKGRVGNPLGKNQYVEKSGEGHRQDMIGFRGPAGLKEEIKKAAIAKNQTVSQWILDSVQLRLQEETSTRKQA